MICTRSSQKTVGGLLTFIILLLAVGGCGKKQADSGQKGQLAPQIVKGLQLETVATASLPETLEVVGTLRARTSALIAARIPGIVSVLEVREGDRVHKGELLAQLEAAENQATAAVAVAGSDEARRGLDEALARKKLADATFGRYQQLFTEQAITRQEFEVKQTEKELAAQSVARAEARLQQAEAGSKAARTMANYTRIIAPIAGIITSKQVDLGASVFPGQPLMTIEDEGSYQLELAIPESMSAKVKPGTPVQITLDALNSSVSTRIDEIVPSADPASRTFTAKVRLNQKGLRSGMFGRGAISLETTVKGIVVPLKAIFERGALTYIWVVDKENIAHLRLVKVGKQGADTVTILAGLTDGERVICSGVEKVSEGTRVE
jgi:RND family efflux transporter MFP subunit